MEAAKGLSRISYLICYKSTFFKKFYGIGTCKECAVPLGGEECAFLQQFCNDCAYMEEVVIPERRYGK